jgi:general stress protein 26
MAGDGDKAERLLAAARQIRAKIGDCWVMTAANDDGAHGRIVVPIPVLPGDDEWIIWFLTGRHSRKVREIRPSGRLTLGYQHPPDRSYVALSGAALVVEDRAIVGRHWQEAWNTVFPRGAADDNAVVVRVEVDRIEVWSPGVTAVTRHETLIRDQTQQWIVASD